MASDRSPRSIALTRSFLRAISLITCAAVFPSECPRKTTIAPPAEKQLSKPEHRGSMLYRPVSRSSDSIGPHRDQGTLRRPRSRAEEQLADLESFPMAASPRNHSSFFDTARRRRAIYEPETRLGWRNVDESGSVRVKGESLRYNR